MDVAAFLAASKAHPPPRADGSDDPSSPPMTTFAYGTAGFRLPAELLDSTMFRCGAVAAIRSAATGAATDRRARTGDDRAHGRTRARGTDGAAAAAARGVRVDGDDDARKSDPGRGVQTDR